MSEMKFAAEFGPPVASEPPPSLTGTPDSPSGEPTFAAGYEPEVTKLRMALSEPPPMSENSMRSLWAGPETESRKMKTPAKETDEVLQRAPGFRFYPTDEELVNYYLTRKVMNKPARYHAFSEVRVYEHDPWELEGYSRMKTRDQEYFFFTVMDKTYGGQGKMSRMTKTGYWKTTGKDREICRGFACFGFKKTLVFHRGRAPEGVRTNWVMHEYRLSAPLFYKYNVHQEYYVLCRIFHKNSIGPPNNKDRYAPFMEEDWNEDDDAHGMIPATNLKVDRDDQNQPVATLINLNDAPDGAVYRINPPAKKKWESRKRDRSREAKESVDENVPNQSAAKMICNDTEGSSNDVLCSLAVSTPQLFKTAGSDRAGNSSEVVTDRSIPGSDETGQNVASIRHDRVKNGTYNNLQKQIYDLSCELEKLKCENEELKNIIRKLVNNNKKIVFCPLPELTMGCELRVTSL